MKVEARGLRVSLRGREVLRGLNAVAHPGELTAVVGPNGAGKSTLLRALAGLLRLDAGLALVDGQTVSDRDPVALAQFLAYLPQGRAVHWALTVRAIVALGRLPFQPLGAGERATDVTAINAALAAMRIEHLASRPISELSGGERARVLVARALAQEPRVLLADEPAAGLDPAHQIGLFQHLAALAQADRTVVVALHDLSLAARFCHSVILVHEGHALASGPPAGVLTPENLAAAYGISARYHSIGGVPVVVPLDVLP